MAQIIDMEERRKPRPAPKASGPGGLALSPLEPFGYLDQLVAPSIAVWQAWLASWASLWLAPLGLQVNTVVPTPPATPRDRDAGPRR